MYEGENFSISFFFYDSDRCVNSPNFVVCFMQRNFLICK
ncbi:hypothetical protein Cs308_0170 [Candidatus Chlamydia sanziniae]|uniref:Uncharacterized protein n=1 Tax=Candidatus Chlamydia sanziniae TaxID=1806891 RepID=A0A1A9HVB4_9CHLA|nr:hypothetical protein Cs308_0170 [Candidatus Chlamydia sanziniae]